MTKLRSRLTYPHVVSTLALFIALGGTAWAVGANTIGSRELKANSVRASETAAASIGTREVINRSLLTEDFAPGQLPAGQQGERGPQGVPGPGGTGPQGLPGAPGSPDTAMEVLDKVKQVDGSGSGLDADRLGGKPLSEVASHSFNLVTAGFVQTSPSSGFSLAVFCEQGAMQLIFPSAAGTASAAGVANLMYAVDGIETPTAATNSFNLINGAGRTGSVVPGDRLVRLRLGDTSGNAGAEIQLIVSTTVGTYSAAIHMFHIAGATPYCEANGTITPGVDAPAQ